VVPWNASAYCEIGLDGEKESSDRSIVRDERSSISILQGCSSRETCFPSCGNVVPHSIRIVKSESVT